MSEGARPLSLVVPVYNEESRVERSIAPLVGFVAGFGPASELIFVDDGSTDTTAALIEKLVDAQPARVPCHVRVIRCPHRGKGAAVQTGIMDADGLVVAFCDVDLATPLAELQRIVDVAAGGVLAIGSRGLPTSELGVREHRVRELLGNAFNRAAQWLVTPGIADTQCGAKAAPRELWHAILPTVREAGFAWDVEVVARALALGMPVAEVPIEWNHQPGSGVRVARDGLRMVRALVAIRRRVPARRAGVEHETVPASRAPDARPAAAGAFDDWNARALAASDVDHWWFRSKAAYVNWALGTATPVGGRLADVGAGSGGVTARLAWDRSRLVAVEANDELASRARAAHRLTVVRAQAAALPFGAGTLAVVCLLDVIEHSTDPVSLLRAAHAALAPGGVCVVTVPGHRRLWSHADEVLGHQRRYGRRTLRAELTAAGFRVERVTHMFSWLVLPVWLRRRVTHAGTAELGLDVDSPWITRAALVLTACERAVLRRVSLPLGTSVLAVARREHA